MGLMFETMGDHASGIRMLRKAVRIDPTDDFAVADLASFEEGPLSSPIYCRDDVFCRSSELLAVCKLSESLSVLASRRSLRASRFRARIYGARNDAPRVLETWEQIMRQRGRLNIETADWFYLPCTVWHDPSFWRMLLQMIARIEDWSVLKGHESLWDTGLRGHERFELFLRYHLAKTCRDLVAARTLAKRYPQWIEAAGLAKRLAART